MSARNFCFQIFPCRLCRQQTKEWLLKNQPNKINSRLTIPSPKLVKNFVKDPLSTANYTATLLKKNFETVKAKPARKKIFFILIIKPNFSPLDPPSPKNPNQTNIEKCKTGSNIISTREFLSQEISPMKQTNILFGSLAHTIDVYRDV